MVREVVRRVKELLAWLADNPMDLGLLSCRQCLPSLFIVSCLAGSILQDVPQQYLHGPHLGVLLGIGSSRPKRVFGQLPGVAKALRCASRLDGVEEVMDVDVDDSKRLFVRPFASVLMDLVGLVGLKGSVYISALGDAAQVAVKTNVPAEALPVVERPAAEVSGKLLDDGACVLPSLVHGGSGAGAGEVLVWFKRV
jgi:hypothetical protein